MGCCVCDHMAVERGGLVVLHLYFDSLSRLRKRKEFIPYPDVLFNSLWEPEWVNDPLSRAIIHDIDQVEMPDGVTTEMACIMSGFRVADLCSDTKNLLLCRYYSGLNRMTMMGENCYKYLMDIADERDVYMGCSSYCFFSDDDLKGRTVHFINTDEFVSNSEDFLWRVIDIVDENGALK